MSLLREVRINLHGQSGYISLLLFMGVVFTHSAFSFPFPKTVGLIEMIVGAFMVAYAVYSFDVGFIKNSAGRVKVTWTNVSIAYLILVPLTFTLVGGWPVRNVIRDVFPLLFLLMPFFCRERNLHFTWTALICSFGGALLSLRYYRDAGVDLSVLGQEFFADSFLVYAYDPLVLFGAIYSFSRIFSGSWVYRIINCGISVVCLIALFGVFQRAPIAMFIGSAAMIGMFGTRFRFSVKRSFFVAAGAIAIVVYQSEYVFQLFDGLLQKQSVSGLNSKDAEFRDIVQQLDNPIKLLFGIGWGGIFYSSAYGGMYWNTHSAVTYFLIKGGVLGLSFFLILMGVLLRRLSKIIRVDFGLFLACLMPLLVGFLFQPTYKTIAYGLVVLVALSAVKSSVVRNRKVEYSYGVA